MTTILPSPEWLEARQREREARTGEVLSAPPRLVDFVPEISPAFERPVHLAPFADVLERAWEVGEVRACCSVPPQFGKTELELHALAWALKHWPEKNNAFVGYSITFARKKSLRAQRLAVTAGVEIDPRMSGVDQWQTTSGGGLVATGIGGPLTGMPIDGCLIIDDPYKNPAQAYSSGYRRSVRDWLTDVGIPRVHPGASIIVTHTRWHRDDLIGTLTQQEAA